MPFLALATAASSLHFVPAPSWVVAKCRATAHAVGYAVPCPTRLPTGFAAGGAQSTGCIGIISPGGIDGCAHSWRGWVVGSAYIGDEHLVLTASPRPLTSYAHLVNGPAWYPRARVRPLGWVTVRGRRMRSVFVPAATNDGSAFMNHVVFSWTTGGHTYGFGFHDVHGIRAALALDVQLARGIVLVRP